MSTTAVLPGPKLDRLNTASLRRVLEPEELFDWDSLGSGQVIPDELLSVHGLDLGLSAEATHTLAREEVAAMLAMGVRFEAVLMAGFSFQIVGADDLADPRVTYMLHEMGEETRHSRAFTRLMAALRPTAVNPFSSGPANWVSDRVIRSLIHSPALLYVMVLAGEEIPDLLQKRAAEHPDTAPLLAAVNRYHRQEEARHLAYARLVLPELWAEAGKVQRMRVLHAAPREIGLLFSSFVHPGVYATVGLPAMATWKAANRTPQRQALKHAATRPVLQALLDAGVTERGSIPSGWQKLCAVDAAGVPLPDAPVLAPVGG